MNEKKDDIIREVEEVAEIGERKSQLEEAAEVFNRLAPEGETITKEQIEAAQRNIERIAHMVKSLEGKCKVIGIDRFYNKDWIENEYDTPEEALEAARNLTEEARPFATHHSVAKVYYAYDPDGNYLGGDTWIEE